MRPVSTKTRSSESPPSRKSSRGTVASNRPSRSSRQSVTQRPGSANTVTIVNTDVVPSVFFENPPEHLGFPGRRRFKKIFEEPVQSARARKNQKGTNIIRIKQVRLKVSYFCVSCRHWWHNSRRVIIGIYWGPLIFRSRGAALWPSSSGRISHHMGRKTPSVYRSPIASTATSRAAWHSARFSHPPIRTRRVRTKIPSPVEAVSPFLAALGFAGHQRRAHRAARFPNRWKRTRLAHSILEAAREGARTRQAAPLCAAAACAAVRRRSGRNCRQHCHWCSNRADSARISSLLCLLWRCRRCAERFTQVPLRVLHCALCLCCSLSLPYPNSATRLGVIFLLLVYCIASCVLSPSPDLSPSPNRSRSASRDPDAGSSKRSQRPTTTKQQKKKKGEEREKERKEKSRHHRKVSIIIPSETKSSPERQNTASATTSAKSKSEQVPKSSRRRQRTSSESSTGGEIGTRIG